jgi:hypothetical protein
MSRSRKKTPIHGLTLSRSEKRDKRTANRRLRARQRHDVQSGAEVLTIQREASNVYSFAKDGKHYVRKWEDEKMKKKMMRK